MNICSHVEHTHIHCTQYARYRIRNNEPDVGGNGAGGGTEYRVWAAVSGETHQICARLSDLAPNTTRASLVVAFAAISPAIQLAQRMLAILCERTRTHSEYDQAVRRDAGCSLISTSALHVCSRRTSSPPRHPASHARTHKLACVCVCGYLCCAASISVSSVRLLHTVQS